MSVSKKCIGLMLFLVMLMTVSIVSALPVEIKDVKLDGDVLSPTGSNPVDVRALDRDNQFEIKVNVIAEADVDNAQIEVYLRGYDHSDLVQDISDVFDMRENRSYVKKFELNFPYRLDKDTYKLRVRVENRDGDATEQTYEIAVESQRHDMIIKDVVFSPSNAVVAGRSLLTTVRIENIGMVDDTNGVKVSITIPKLGVAAADYIDEIDEDDSVTSEELYLRIPPCVDAGTYDATISVVYDDGDEVATVDKQINVIADETCNKQEETTPQAKPKTIITVGPATQDVVAGQGGVIYPMTLTNAGPEAKTYVVSADGYAEWADVSISPANIVVVNPGEAEAVYVYLSAKEDASLGEHMFSLKVSSAGETLKEFTLKANVAEAEAPEPSTAQWSTVRKVLEIGLVVLVILLVILGLIIGFSRLRGRDTEPEDEESKSETYY